MFGTGAGFGGGHGDSGAGDTPQRLVDPTSGPLPTPQTGHNAPASPGDCLYFLLGTCTKGDSCLFRHNHAAKANGIVCRFWQNGFCKDATNCSFQHPVGAGRGHVRSGPGNRFIAGRGMGGRAFGGGRGNSRAPTEAVGRSKPTCVFFAQGICTKGDACQFSHATLQENGAGQAMNRAIGSGNEPQRTGAAEEHILVMPGSRNGDVPEHIKVGGADGTGAAFFGSAVKGTEERPPVMRLSGASTSMHIGTELGSDPFSAAPPVMIGGDGNTYVVGPDGLVPLDAVMRTMAATAKDTQPTPSTAPRNPATVEPQQRSTFRVRNDRSRVAVTPQSSLQALDKDKDKDPQKSGIITLPDGGFVTRKRAAEMQLLGERRGDKDLRCIRQREAREQVNQHDRLGGKEEGRAAPQASGRPSIMDRLGPAKQQSITSTSWERTVGPKMTRPEVPAQSSRKREEPRQLSAPVDRSRDGPPVNRPSPLSRSQALGTARSTRRSDDGSGQGTLAGTVVTTRPTVHHKPASLDFKISTLDEIKTRKAKAKVKTDEARTEATTTARKIQSGDDQTTAKAIGQGSSQGAEAPVVAPPASVGKGDVSDTAPAIPVPSDVLQLEEDDMIEFRQWL